VQTTEEVALRAIIFCSTGFVSRAGAYQHKTLKFTLSDVFYELMYLLIARRREGTPCGHITLKQAGVTA
jgi:hypothetical protein